MLSKKTLVSVVSVALLSGVAMASPDEYEAYYSKRGPMPFEMLDLNSDGVVTAEEHAAVRSKRQAARAEMGYPMRNAKNAPAFEQIDVDSSGEISRAELDAWRGRCMQNRGKGFGKW